MPDHKEMLRRARELRDNMTEQERKLWFCFLKDYPVKYRGQFILDDKYILDFYCFSAKLAIELDGSQHFSEHGEKYDEKRTAYLSARGITVIRIPNNEINKRFYDACTYIDWQTEMRLKEMQTPLAKRMLEKLIKATPPPYKPEK